ncbi:MAG: Mu transposase C-terminal domain-containing protein [Cyanobacteria bacterium P01_F01_bin.143]
MLSEDQFNQWCDRLNLTKKTRQLIEQIRASEPSRLVGGRRSNVCGRYPSQKMGRTIQFESHRVEAPKIYEMEQDQNILEYYDQPPPIKLNYESKNGRNLGVIHTPDFFVIENNSAGWIECKPEEELKKLIKKQPNRYYCDTDGIWGCPPGEEYAKQFGLNYTICSDKEFNWTIQRNFLFLEDYYRAESLVVDESVKNSIIALLSEQTGITLAELIDPKNNFNADEVYSLIVNKDIYVDLESSLLVESQRVKVFCNEQTAKAHDLITTESTDRSINFPPVVNLSTGNLIYWDGKGLEILHVGDTEITLADENRQLINVKTSELENLVRQGKITSLQSPDTESNQDEAWQKFYKASPEDQAEALHRYETIKPYLDCTPPETETVSSRTMRDWKSKYLAAQKKYNCGLIGLLSHRNSRGNRSRKLPQESFDLMNKVIDEDYETYKQKTKWSSYCKLVELCEQKGVLTPSYKTFRVEIKKRSSYKQTKKRQGRRAAYKHKEFYWQLDRTTPRHGDRPFEIGHIDHTELDIELVCSKTGRNLGRPWATFFNDAYSRKILAVYLTLDPPSYRSCLMALRICVKRHGRLPQIIVVDNGSEFNSTYFETLLATFEITKKQRPPAQARFGSVCERLFGTSNTQFVYNLQGNTQITRNVRQVTKSVNPKNQAIWTLAFLYDYLCHWAYEIYDTIDHPALHQSPREAFAQGMLQSGSRSHRMIPYNKDFCMLTLPTTSKGKAKVQPGNGVKINYIYYWSNQFRDPEIEKTLVPIRYDPFNVGIAYAYVKGQWVECISQYYADFQGHTEKELKLASSEIRKRNQNHTKNNKISAKKLANFLASAEAQEALFKQRTNDLETQQVLQIVEGKVKPLSQHQNQTIQQQEVESKSSQSSITVEFKEVREPESTENEAPEEFDLDELEIYEEF